VDFRRKESPRIGAGGERQRSLELPAKHFKASEDGKPCFIELAC